MTSDPKPKTLLIGWDAADWKAINPLLEAGKMPNLQRMIEQGVSGNLATLQPALSPTLWTSIATGKRPYKHGIHGFSEPDPITGGIRPVTNLSRKTKAIWNILNQTDHHSITIGWWPSNPAEPLSKGVMVSNNYQRSTNDDPDKWQMKPGTVHPQRLEKPLKELRFHPSELLESDLRAFLPGLDGMSQEELDKFAKDPRLHSLAKIIADCTSIHSATTALMDNEPWDFLAVYYDAIDHFGHGFMKFHPPQRPEVSDEDFRLFHYIVEAGYRYHDMMLGALLNPAGENTNVILISDHGFHPDDFRLTTPPREPAGPAAEHRQFGIFAAIGPDFKKGTQLFGASLIDICPTLLQLFRLPVGEDMDGRVLHSALSPELSKSETIPSWDDVEGDHGMHPDDVQISAGDSKAALEQLVALGYIDKPDQDQSTALENTVRELDYNLAQSYIDGGLFLQAVLILERLYKTWPMEHRFGFKLATCYSSLNRTRDLKQIVETVCERRIKEAENATEELKSLKLDDPEIRKAEDEKVKAMNPNEQQKFARQRRELIAKARPNLFSLNYFSASADFAEGNYQEALDRLEQLDSEYGARRNALTLKGQIHQRLKHWQASREAFNEALSMDPESSEPLLGLARTALAERKYSEAADFAKRSTQLLHFQPRAHYLRGLAEYRAGNFPAAEHAFLTCVSQTPLAAAAYRMLAQLATRIDKDPIKAEFYRQRQKAARDSARELRNKRISNLAETPASTRQADETEMPDLAPKPDHYNATPEDQIITIVSGLPRSGTSLMMQLLEAAGISPMSDGKRAADENNAKGYYEYEPTTKLLRDPNRAWVADAVGKSLKIVAPLIASLPPKTKNNPSKLPYRFIFMEREIGEIMDSQEKMISNLGTQSTKTERPADPAKAYIQQIKSAKTWINGHGFPAISINFNQLIKSPDTELEKLATFLNQTEALENMKNVIDPTMHRSKTPESVTN